MERRSPAAPSSRGRAHARPASRHRDRAHPHRDPANLAYVQVRARYAAGKDQPAWYRGVMIWRKEADGQWRMLHEMLVGEKRPSRE